MSWSDFIPLYGAIAASFYYFLRANDERRRISLILAATAPVSITAICFYSLWRIHSLCSPVLPKARVVSGGEGELSNLQQR